MPGFSVDGHIYIILIARVSGNGETFQEYVKYFYGLKASDSTSIL